MKGVWYTHPGTLFLGLFVRALLWMVKAISWLFGRSEKG
jgi:hypothetical protein